MKLPALWLAAALGAGIALAGTAPQQPRVWLAVALVTLAAGLFCAARRWLLPALVLSLAAWLLLGLLAAQLDRVAVPRDHVTRLVADNARPLEHPLRWRGRLRSDPVGLPWGVRYEIELEEVEVAGQPRAVTGGLRASLYADDDADAAPPELPAVRAGDRVEALLRARPPRNFGNPGSFDARAHLARQGVDLLGTLRSPELLTRLGQPAPTLAHRAARLRGRLLDRVDALFADSPRQAAVLRAMLLGDRSFLDHELAGVFQRTAAYHVLVVSGLHVGALAGFIWLAGAAVRLRPGLRTLLTLAVLAAFVAVVEDRPPILRAALMAATFLTARLLFRRVELLNTIAVAAVLVLLASPASLVDPSFQFSFLAAGMIAAPGLAWIEQSSAPLRRALRHLSDVSRDAGHARGAAQFRLDLRATADWLARRLPKKLPAAWLVTAPCRVAFRLWEVLLISLAVQIGLLPLMAHYFNRVTLSGPLVNIPATLLAGLIVPVGFLALAVSAVWSAVGEVLVGATGVLASALTASVEWFGRWTAATYRIPGPPAWVLAAFFAALVLLAWAARRGAARRDAATDETAALDGRLSPGKQLLAAAPLVALAVVVAVHPFAPDLAGGRLEVTVLDVGQGDAIFVASPEGRTLLVDGGGMFSTRRGGFRGGFDIGEAVVSRYLWHRGLERLDAVALTHAHLDHMDGLHAVLENFRVAEMWVGRPVRTAEYRELVARADGRGTEVVAWRRGEWRDWGGAVILALWPEDTAEADAVANNDSLVLRVEHGARAFLLAGEIEREVEQVLVERDDPLAADFLKVPHHGSRTSAHPAFVAAASPRVAAISVGAGNPFGHPHREVLAALARPGLEVLRTDRDGAITVTSDGRQIQVRTYWRGGER